MNGLGPHDDDSGRLLASGSLSLSAKAAPPEPRSCVSYAVRKINKAQKWTMLFVTTLVNGNPATLLTRVGCTLPLADMSNSLSPSITSCATTLQAICSVNVVSDGGISP